VTHDAAADADLFGQNAFGWQAACGLDVTYFDERAQAAERCFLGLSG
jgi:hypothetical protein